MDERADKTVIADTEALTLKGLKTVLLECGNEQLLEDFTLWGVTVPAGFISDGASTPPPFWAIIPPYKDTKEAAYIHDYLCSVAKSKRDRLIADNLWFVTLVSNPRINNIRAIIGYIGVRIGAVFGVGVKYPHWTNLWRGKAIRTPNEC